jgi:hypothetical protein
VKKCSRTDGRILDTSCIVVQRVPADGCVIIGVIERKGSIPDASISVATTVGVERAEPGGYVVVASRVAKKRL